MKFEEAIKAAAEVSRKDGKPYKLIFDGCETNLMISADTDYEDAYGRLCGAERLPLRRLDPLPGDRRKGLYAGHGHVRQQLF